MNRAAETIRVRVIETNAMRAVLVVSVSPDVERDAGVDAWRGELYGPIADDRTTLPASFSIPEFPASSEARVAALEPCYWSPESPLEYELTLHPYRDGTPAGEPLCRTIRLRTLKEAE